MTVPFNTGLESEPQFAKKIKLKAFKLKQVNVWRIYIYIYAYRKIS